MKRLSVSMKLLPVVCLPLFFVTALCAAPPRKTSPASASPRKPLDKTIDAILAEAAVSHAHWGISVVTAQGAAVYARNEGESFQPASNTKLFTTAAAFAVFLPENRFATKIVARGVLDADGTLRGDLVLQGSGDPTLSGRVWPYAGKTERTTQPLRALEGMADEIAKGGLIHKVTGRVVGDDTFFPFERYGAGWSWDDLQWEYGAPASALSVNDNVVVLDLTPGANLGDPVIASWNPPVPYYTLDNTATTGAAAPKPELGVDRPPGSKTVRLYGTLPVNSKGIHLELAMEDPAEFAAIALREMLTVRGISVDGVAAAQHVLSNSTADFLEEVRTPLPMPLPTQTTLAEVTTISTGIPADRALASYTSPPLAVDLVLTNKVSQNLHAELLLRDLGKAVLNDGSIAAGARVIRQFLLQAGVLADDVLFFDGSGMSAQDLITPRAATTLLAYASRQPWGEAYRATLPIAGVDGTLAGRFTHSPIKGRLFAKTGTLSETNTLSGYLIARSGKTVILSILCNSHDPSSDATRKTAEKIVEAIYAAE